MTARRAVAVAERTLPHNLEAERSILGAILLHNDAYEKIAKTLEAADFYRDAHRRIFDAIERLLERPGGGVDLVTLKESLGSVGDLDEVGGPAYISALIDGVPRSTNVEHYARIVREKATLRRLIVALNRVTSQAYAAEEPAAAIVTAADRVLVEIQKDALGGAMQSLAKSNVPYAEALDYRIAHKGELTGIPTGFQKIDEMTMGWQRGHHIIVAARPSIGKSAFILNSARAAARAWRRGSDTERNKVAIFSMEMERIELEDRLLSNITGIPSTLLRGGYVFGDEQMAAIVAGLEEMRTLGIYIDDTTGRTVEQIRAECRRLKAEGGLDEVIIDYIQLMPGSLERRGANRTEELTDISRRFKNMAGELGVPIIILSQLSRASESRPDPRPKLSDLRECGALEQDANLACFLHRRNHKEGGITQFIIEKARNGPTGVVNLDFDRDTTTFKDYEGEPPAEPAPAPEEKKAKQVAFFKQRSRH